MGDKNQFGKFLDWVNADENLPTLNDLESAHDHGHEDHGHAGGGAEDHSHVAASPQDPHQAASPAETANAQTPPEAKPSEDGQKSQASVTVGEAPDKAPAPAPVSNTKAQPEAGAAVLTESEKKSLQTAGFSTAILSGLLATVIIITLLIATGNLPEFGSADNPTVNEVYTRYVEQGTEETGAVNVVAAMILDYRAFDTLGESIVLFTAVMGVVMLIRTPKESPENLDGEGGAK